MSDRESCKTCLNWRDRCLCPMWNDADSMTFHTVGTPRIVAAAMRHSGTTYAVAQPARHHNVMAMMRHRFGINTATHENVDGFLVSDGRFVERPEALVIARASRQAGKLLGSVLTSEDMW